MFLNDGTPHYDGIANEHFTIYMINHNPKLAPIREKLGFLVHRGGTQQNPDADVPRNRGEGVFEKQGV
jgi:hypothetical protein